MAEEEDSKALIEDSFHHLWNDAQNNTLWKRVKDQPRDLFKRSYKHKKFGDCLSMKATAIVPASMEEVIAQIKGIDHVEEWDPFFKSGTVLESWNENCDIIHSVYSTHVPAVPDRDFVFIECRKMRDDGAYMSVVTSVERSNIPVGSNTIRAKLAPSGFILFPTADAMKTSITYMLQVNIKGSIPVWLKQKLMMEIPQAIDRIGSSIRNKILKGMAVSLQTVIRERQARDSVAMLKKMASKRKFVAEEILQSERNYFKSLNIADTMFRVPLISSQPAIIPPYFQLST
eukprot:TRINITY_DN631_c2_g1_i2.p1 TRINITY_DN631_c2_g1~~TRINITY_DN631_c2_g1_i2.p1  ORF type:complete len:299 (+),score=77.10 TRINITY_DN631_c2_g1_i2:39-899(+)